MVLTPILWSLPLILPVAEVVAVEAVVAVDLAEHREAVPAVRRAGKYSEQQRPIFVHSLQAT